MRLKLLNREKKIVKRKSYVQKNYDSTKIKIRT